MKRIPKKLILFLSLVGGIAQANILVNAPPPAPQHVMGDSGYTLYFAASSGSTLAAGAHYDATDGYRLIPATISGSTYTGGLIYLDISTDAPPAVTGTQEIAVTLGTAATAGDEIPLTGASLVGGNAQVGPDACTNGNCIQGSRNSTFPFLSAIYSPGTTLRVSFALSDLCATAAVQTSVNSSICPADSGNFKGDTNLSQTIYVSFSVVDPSSTPYPVGDLTKSPFSTNVVLTDVAPTIATPSPANIEDFYAPGDQSIIFDADNYGPNTGVGGDGAPLQNLIILADRTQTNLAITADAIPTYEVHDNINSAGADQIATGFVNATSACTADSSASSGYNCSNGYNATIYSMNQAGIISLAGISTPFTTGQGDVSADGLLHAETVNSVLSNSQCFIATTAFHNGSAAPVMMLRRFRDQVLSKSSLGQDFIKTYYTYSPKLAAWAWDKPIVRSVALHVLAPVEAVAWAILELSHSEEVSSQPYIDRVKKKLDEEQPPKPDASNESYIDSIKKTLSPTPAESGSYIDKVKKTLPPPEASSDGYSAQAKKDLPPADEVESPITKVKEGKDKPLEPKRPPITTAVGAKFGVSPGMKVTNTKGVVDFQQMYGNGSSWQPDLVLHYERQSFHSENFGSLAFQADLGISYAEGYGQYQYGFGSTDTKLSQTKFSFIQLPLTIGALYRFNLLRVLRPYAGISVGSMFYTEIRSDDNPDKRGLTPIYELEGGASLLLDFLDKHTSTEGFMSEGIQHTYITLEFMRMDTFQKTGVLFQRNGIYGGVLFEY